MSKKLSSPEITYPSSTLQRELIGPYQLLKAGTVDIDVGTITMPLYRGQMADGTAVWYIVTDTRDKGNADALGLNWSPAWRNWRRMAR